MFAALGGGFAGSAPEMKRRIALNLTTRVFSLLFGFLTILTTARLLSLEDRGLYFLGFVLATTAAQLTSFGLAPVLTVFSSRGQTKPTVLHGHAIVAASFSLAISVFVLYVIFGLFGRGRSIADFEILLVGLAASLMVYTMLSLSILNGIGKYVAYNLFEVSTRAIGFAVVTGSLLFLPTFQSGLVGLVASLALVASVQFWLKWRLYGAPSFDLAGLRNLVGFALRTWAVSGVSFLLWKQNAFLAAANESPDSYGIWSVGGQLVESVFLFGASIAVVVLPIMSERESGRLRIFRRAILALSSILLVLLGVWLVAGAWVIDVFFGPEYHDIFFVFLWAYPGVVLHGIASVVSQYISSNGTPLLSIIPWILGISSNFLFVVFSAGSLGLNVYSVGYSLGQVIATIGLVFVAIKVSKR